MTFNSFDERRRYCEQLIKISDHRVYADISFCKFNEKYYIPVIYFKKEAILFDIFYKNDMKPSSAFISENDWIIHKILQSNHNFRKVVLYINQQSIIPSFSFCRNAY